MRSLSREWHTTAVLVGAVSASTLTGRWLAPLAPFVKGDLALGDVQVGFLSSALLLGSLMTTLPLSMLVDCHDNRLLLSVVLGGLGIVLGLAAVQRSFEGLIVALCIAGAMRGGITPMVNSAVVRVVPPERWGTATGVILAGGPVAGLGAAIALPYMAQRSSWHASLGFVAALLLIAALATWLLFPLTESGAPRPNSPLTLSWRVLADRTVLLLCIIYAGYASGLFATVSFFVLYLVEELNISPVVAGFCLAIAQSTAILGRVLWGVVGDHTIKIRRKTLLSVLGGGMWLALILLSLLPKAPHMLPLVAVSLLLGFTALASWGLATALLLDVARPEYAGASSGVLHFSIYVVGVISPAAFGFVSDVTDTYRIAFRCFAFLALGSSLALVAMPLRRASQSDSAPVSS